MMRLYMKVRRSRSSAMDGISFGSPADVPELQADDDGQIILKYVKIIYDKQKVKQKLEFRRTCKASR